jgi:iron complex outermembrane receptor protein
MIRARRNRLHRKWRIRALPLLAALVATMAAQAQQARSDWPALPEAALEDLGEIVVTGTSPIDGYAVPVASTGTKTDVPLMETPINVQAVTQQEMVDQAIFTLDKALTNISGVTSANQSGTQDLIVRGFDTNQVLFVDGVRIYDHFGTGSWNFADIERVEVMKGPAAILYGDVQPGGIVNLVSKKPQSAFAGSAEQFLGSWHESISRVDVTGPLDAERRFLYRVDGSVETSASWIDGVWQRTNFVSPTIQWNLTPATQLSLKYLYDHNPGIADNNQVEPIVNGRLVPIPRHVNLSDPAYDYGSDDKTRVMLNLSHEFDERWTLRTQASLFSARGSGATANVGPFLAPGTPGNVGIGWNVNLYYYSFSQEDERTKALSADLIGKLVTGPVRHTLLLGADYNEYSEPTQYVNPSLGFPSAGYAIPVDVTTSTPVALDTNPADIQNSSQLLINKGGYVQDQMKLPGNLDVLAGLRFQSWLQEATTFFAGGVGQGAGADYSSFAVTPRIGAVWEADRTLSVYALYSDGFSPNPGFDWQGRPLRATGADDREVGVKYLSADGRLQGTLTVFHLLKTHTTEPDVWHCVGHGNCPYEATVGAIRSKGIELDLRGDLTRDWKVILNYAYTNARVAADTNSLATTGVPSTEGDRLANDPFHMGGLWSTYEVRLSDAGKLIVGGGVSARGASVDSLNLVSAAGYAVTNAMARFETKWGSSKLGLQLNVDNLFNRDTTLFGYPYEGFWPNTAGVVYGDPRSIKASVRVEF